MLSKPKSVIPAEAGIQCFNYLDTGLRRCDELNQCFPSDMQPNLRIPKNESRN